MNINTYNCYPANKYNDICKQEQDGIYKTKEECRTECENKYIYNNLKKAGLSNEVSIYYRFIRELLNMNIDVYLKGGNPLGMQVLKMIAEKYTDKNIFKKYFEKFLELNLVKDWDFHCYTHKEITGSMKKKFKKLARQNNLVSRGSKLILYQTRKPIEIAETALFEVSIWEKDNYSELESVMSTMKIKVSNYNLKYIFMLAASFYSYTIKKQDIDLDVIIDMLKKINVSMYDHKDGFFVINDKTYNDGGLSSGLLEMIDTFIKTNNYNNNAKQFLISHIKEPKRMYYRLLEKNLPKADKIYHFLRDNKIVNNIPTWLFNTPKILKLVDLFTKELKKHILDAYNKLGIDGLMKFLVNVNFKPLRDEYDRFTPDGLNYIKILLNELYSKIKDKLDTKSEDKEYAIFSDILNFLHKRELLV